MLYAIFNLHFYIQNFNCFQFATFLDHFSVDSSKPCENQNSIIPYMLAESASEYEIIYSPPPPLPFWDFYPSGNDILGYNQVNFCVEISSENFTGMVSTERVIQYDVRHFQTFSQDLALRYSSARIHLPPVKIFQDIYAPPERCILFRGYLICIPLWYKYPLEISPGI